MLNTTLHPNQNSQRRLEFLEARSERKHARTRIYTLLYGEQDWSPSAGPRPNKPWLDTTRNLPQEVDTDTILDTMQGPLWFRAAFPLEVATILIDRLNVLRSAVAKSHVGLRYETHHDGSFDLSRFRVVEMTGRH